jgi:glycosyltransferase involved in cell wall biosynthesis
MKTVLSLIDWYLPGSKAGGALKAFANQVSHFNEDYQFRIITRDTDYMDATPYKQVRSNQWNATGENTEVFYASSKNVNYSFLKSLIQDTECDSIYIHGIYSFWFSILPIYLAKKKGIPKIVIAAHGMFGEHAIAVKTFKKKLFIIAAKAFGLYRNVLFHAANEDEAKDIRAAAGVTAKIIIAEEMPMKVALANWQPREKVEGKLKLVSVARIAPEKNTLYALEALLQPTVGSITFDIYGPVYCEEYWGKCEAVIAKLPSNVTVHYKGSLPGQQVLETLSDYHFLFLPSTGENFGHVILESFMASTPVIISDKTPWRNLEAQGVGWELPLENKRDFAAKLTQAANLNQEGYNALSRASHQHAQKFISDPTIKEQNHRLFDSRTA